MSKVKWEVSESIIGKNWIIHNDYKREFIMVNNKYLSLARRVCRLLNREEEEEEEKNA
jgi:hypothetical protein